VTDPSAYYESLDIYINTSLHEGIPMSILEAMAAGIPVVAPQVGGIPEIITDGEEGLLVDNRTPSAFGAACLRLMNDPSLRTRMGARAKAKVEASFSDVAMAAQYRRLYTQGGSRHVQ